MIKKIDIVTHSIKETYFYVDLEDHSKKAMKRVVSDGEIKITNLDYFIFPGISICIPIVVSNSKGKNISCHTC